MAKNNLILGGGVAGLIAAFYNSDFIVLDKNPLGQLNTPFVPGPRIFKVDEYTEAFLNKLGVDFHKETIKIGFTKDSKTVIECDDYFRESYSKLTRGTQKIEKSFLSSGATEIEIFTDGSDNFYKKVFEKLYENVKDRVKESLVMKINSKNKVVKTETEELHYDKCISTLNLNVLCKILGITEIKPKSSKKHFVCTEYSNDFDKELSEQFHYVYSTNGIYSRKTYFKDYIVYETLIPLSYIKDLEHNRIIKIINNLPIQIVNSINLQKIQGIELLGRFAQWNHSIKATEIIKQYESRTEL